VVQVEEDELAEAMVTLMERAKLVVEGAGAVGAAALLAGRVTATPRGSTVVVLSGGNVDAGLLAIHVRESAVQLVMETRGRDHAQAVLSALAAAGHDARVVR